MINLYINERRTGDVTILDLKGKLRIGGNALAMHKSIRCLLSEQKKMILLNLTGVTFIDSCGFGELVASQISVENAGGEIKLVGLTDTLHELFSVTRLLQVFDVYQNEADALQNFVSAASQLEKPQLIFA
ncbi:MAG TPA: STAS domain-containing protein [Pyrinomonadaceae bacterium]|nr:STAS domain-containing protein [Pyrinomonadaceae bacterium]